MTPLEELKPCRHAYEPRLCLELRQPELVALAIPENQPGITAVVPLWIRLSNNTSEPVPFGIYGTLIPELVRADGQLLKPREPVGRHLGTGEQHDCFLLTRGKWQIGICLNTKLRWHDNVLQLWVPALPDNFQVPLERENYWIFEALEPGSYQLRFFCDNPRGEISWWEPKTGRLKKGEAKMELKKVEVLETRAVTAYRDLRLFYPTELNCSAVQEVDGVGFETILLERVLRVPDDQPDAYIDVHLGIRITNNTPNPLHFSFYALLTPELIMPDGQILQGGFAQDWYKLPEGSDFSLAMPGEAVTFFPGASIHRYNDRYQLRLAEASGGCWIFYDLQLGTYQIQLEYRNQAPVEKVLDEESRGKKLIENIWTGAVAMPPMEFSLVYP